MVALAENGIVLFRKLELAMEVELAQGSSEVVFLGRILIVIH